jgi:hypothetical protein
MNLNMRKTHIYIKVILALLIASIFTIHYFTSAKHLKSDTSFSGYKRNLQYDLKDAGCLVNDSKDLFIQILYRISRIISFFDKNYNNVNVDGLFGLRIAEGIFLHILKSNQSYHTFSDHDLVHAIYERLLNLNKKVFESVQIETPVYAQNFDILIRNAFLLNTKKNKNDKWRKLKSSRFISKYKPFDLLTDFNEPFSDGCYSILLERNQTNSECFEFFTEEKASGYYLTHQLLYFLIADHVNVVFLVVHF